MRGTSRGSKQARQRAVRQQRERYFVVIAPPFYAVVPELDVAAVLLEVEGAAKERLRDVVHRQQAARKARRAPLG